MSEPTVTLDVAATVTAIGTLIGTVITAIGSLVTVLIGLRNTRKLRDVHESTNGKMEELLDVTRSSAAARGNLEGRAEQMAEHAATKGTPP